MEEYRLAVEARAAPVGPAVTTANAVAASSNKQKPVIKSNKVSKQSIKGALFVKKKKRESDSEEGEEEEEEEKVKPTAKKQKTSLSLLADYGDISSSSSDSDA